MILVFGSVNVDLVARVEAIARPGETVLSPGHERFFGGKGANQAVAAARMLPPGAPPVVFVGAVGMDAFGDECLANLRSEGIDVSSCQIEEASTGCAFISVARDGENAITVASGSNALLQADGLAGEIVGEAGVLVLQMEVPWRESAAVAARVKASQGRTILNFAPARLDIPAKGLERFLAEIDILVLNEHEAEVIGSALGLGPENIAEALAERFALAVVVTLGARGASLCEPGALPALFPAASVDVVDTTGAGDTFVGALASALFEGGSIRDAVERAGLAAALSCTRPGAQGGSPTREEFDDFARRRREGAVHP